ncbi:MAG: DoxX family protein [Alphaproteobacteria bacterium]
MDRNQARSQLFVPALAGLYDALRPWSYPLMRFIAGIVLAPHGAQKLFGWFGGAGLVGVADVMGKIGLEPGYAWAVFIGSVEFFGGLCVAFGLLTRLAAVTVALEMAYIIAFILWSHGYFWTKGGYEYALLWAVLMVGIAIKGGGAKSLDAMIGREF